MQSMHFTHKMGAWRETLRNIELSLTAIGFLAAANADTALTVELGSGSDSEEAACVQLDQLVDRFNIDRWLFTKQVLIDDSQWIPHSHPVLILNSRYLDEDLSQLATFLHEQFHWYAVANQDRIDAATREFKKMFPVVPSGQAGARGCTSSKVFGLQAA